MVAIVSGATYGVSTSSLATLGRWGVLGAPGQGNNGEQAFVNIATGNLVLQDRDDRLVAEGLDLTALRTYNSLGRGDDDNGDNWSTGFLTRNIISTGTLNTAGSTVIRMNRDGARGTYAFDAATQSYTSTSGAGAYDIVRYDAATSLFTWTDGATGTTERYTKADGHLISMTDPQGNTVQYQYNGGVITKVLAPTGESVKYDYGGGNKLKSVQMVSANNAATTTRVSYEYDSNNRLFRVKVDLTPETTADFLSYSTTYTYEGNTDRVATVTQSDGTSLAFTYILADSTYHIATIKDGLGQTTTFAYDIVNRRTTVTDPLNRVTAYEYDTSNQLTRIVAPAVGGVSQATSFTYNAKGDLIQVTDAAGGIVAMEYDARGNQVLQRDAAGNTVSRTYDEAGRKTADIDGDGSVTEYVYDNARQLLQQSNDRAGLGVNISYGYDAAGQLVHITDGSGFADTSYSYDLAGHRIREKTVQQGVTYQDNHLAYDALGRLKWVADGRAYVTMDYDLMGNRTHIHTHVINGDAAQDSERFFKYDSMNRQIVADAADDAGNLGANGHAITYNTAGQKTSDTWLGNVVSLVPGTTYTEANFTGGSTFVPFTDPDTYKAQLGQTKESYDYDVLGRLIAINRDGKLVDERNYDTGGRTVKSGEANLGADYLAALNGTNSAGQVLGGNGSEVRMSLYDPNGRLASERVLASGGEFKYQLFYTNEPDNTPKIDAAGNSLGYTINDGHNVDRFNYTLERREGYKQVKVNGTRNLGAGDPGPTGDTVSTYDANGFLREVTDSRQSNLNRSFVNDVAGNVLYANQGGHVQRQLVANGEVLGRYGEVVNDKEPKSSDGTPVFTTTADFSFGFRPTGGDIKDAAPASHVVGAGDTLQSIAQMSYGDSRLWYRIAEANGLAGNQDLKAGQVLKIPATESNANAADTFKPYDPSKVVGDTSPFLPAPAAHGGGCGGIGQVLMVVVAIAVTIATEGATAEWAAETAFEAAAVTEGTIGTTVTAINFAAGALAGAAGAVAGQAVGIAIGEQDGFNWKGIALNALSAGISGGLSGVDLIGGAVNGIGNAIARAAVGNALTQGVGVVTGLQKSFSWRGVAASAAGAGVGQMVGAELHNTPFANTFGKAGVGTVASFAGGLTTAVIRGGRISVQQVAVDAFGNALGSSLADQMNTPPLSAGAAWQADVAARKAAINPLGLPTVSRSMQAPDLLAVGGDQVVSDAGNGYGDFKFGAPFTPNATSQAVFNVLAGAMGGQVQDADLRYRAGRVTPGDMGIYQATAQDLSALNFRKIFQPGDLNHYVIGAFLDGTWNARGDGGLTDTRPGTDNTNVGLLELMSKKKSDYFVTQYFNGVGTDSYTKLIGGATGAGISMRAADAYQWMSDQVNGIYVNNSNATFDLLGVGFSRGAMETRMLLHSIDQQGIPDYSSRYEAMVGEGQTEVRYARNIIEPGKANLSAVLFDTVTTGVGDFYNIDLPERAQVYHPIARDEMRSLFPSAPLARPGEAMSPLWFQPVMPGDHSDIGNNHDRGGLGDLNLQLAHQFMTQNLGLPLMAIPSAYAPNPATMWIHGMRGEQGIAPPSNSPFMRPLAPRYAPLQPVFNPYQR